MNKTYFNNQKITAYDNYNYFIMKMIVKIIKSNKLLLLNNLKNYFVNSHKNKQKQIFIVDFLYPQHH